MKRTFLAIFSLLFLFVLTVAVFAQETEEGPAEEAYRFPEIKPEAFFFGGYRTVGHSGDEKADQYEYLHDSVSLGGELRAFSFPHRIHLDLDFKNGKDFFGDASYAYEDIVLFRGINRTLFHNLENVSLVDMDPATSSPGVEVRDRDERYGVKFSDSAVFLRFKTPDFPFHVYFDGTFIAKDGTEQLRSMGGSAFFNDIVRVSRKRDVSWQSNKFVFGVNTHLGPVEMDLSHGEKRLDVSGDKVLFDAFKAAFEPNVLPPDIVRSDGVFPHNLVPEFKSSSNALKIHTSYTGGLVASATFSSLNKENTDSGAKADYFIGAGEVTWIPVPRVAVAVRYRHREADVDNPRVVTVTDATDPSNTYSYTVKPSLSSVTDTASGTVRYRPFSGLTLLADYSYERIRRTGSDEWRLPSSTTRNTIALSANLRIARNANLKARYIHRNIDNPAHNSEPRQSDEGRLSVSWIPLTGLNTLVSYSVAEERRRGLNFIDFNYDPVEGPEDRLVRRKKLLGSVTFMVLKDVSITTSYTYIYNKTQQDLVFLSDTFESVTDPSVPNKGTAHNYSADIVYTPKENMTLHAGVSYAVSRSVFFPGNADLLDQVSVAAFSDLKIRESVYSVSGQYRFRNGFAAEVRYRYSKLNDVLDNPYDDVSDGRAHIVLMTISKKW